MSDSILLIGGGGYCRQVIEIVKSIPGYGRIGIVEAAGSTNTQVDGIPVVGHDDELADLYRAGWTNAAITVGSIGNADKRKELYSVVKKTGFVLPAIISAGASIAESAHTGEGSIIHPGAIVDAGADIGRCAIINKSAILSHDCVTGDLVHVSPGAIVLGSVVIGDEAHIGAGAILREGITVGRNSVIGMGSVVVKDIPESVVAYGNPCRIVRENEHSDNR